LGVKQNQLPTVGSFTDARPREVQLANPRLALYCQSELEDSDMRRLIYPLVIALLLLNLAVGARIYLTSANAAEKDSVYPNLELFNYVMEKVRKDYVDGQELTYQDLVHGALKGMVGTLDPHSEFLDPDRYKELQSDTQGTFGGLGIVVQMRDNFVTVVTPIEDTPGFKAGILSGDRIVKIDGKSTEKMSLQDAVKNLRGDPGTEVSLTVLRPSTGEEKEHRLTRAVINVDMAKDINGRKEFPLCENKIGYVRLTQFGEKTSDELEAALKKLKTQGMEALILDLRWNPGGLLDQAVEVCEKFLPRRQLVVTTEGRSAGQSSIRQVTGRSGAYRNLPVVVLVNLGSASASEIVAGCLQDCATLGVCKAIVVGEQTFGKGSVQSIIPLPDGASALRLTTAKYYTPSHKVIHEQGITPDLIVSMSDEEENIARLKLTPGGVESLDDKERERIATVRDPQLDRAMDVLKGIMIFAQRLPEEKGVSGPEKIASSSAEAVKR
jgi:carboxyl-terminal processing protease